MDIQKTKLKVGDTIEIDSHELLITEINGSVSLKRHIFTVTAIDLDTAQNTQAEQMKGEQLQHQVLDALKSMFGSGGNFPMGLGGGGPINLE